MQRDDLEKTGFVRDYTGGAKGERRKKSGGGENSNRWCHLLMGRNVEGACKKVVQTISGVRFTRQSGKSRKMEKVGLEDSLAIQGGKVVCGRSIRRDDHSDSGGGGKTRKDKVENLKYGRDWGRRERGSWQSGFVLRGVRILIGATIKEESEPAREKLQ